MVKRLKNYIGGEWVESSATTYTPVVNPATEEAMYEIALGSKADVDKAVASAKRAFETFSQTSRDERVARGLDSGRACARARGSARGHRCRSSSPRTSAWSKRSPREPRRPSPGFRFGNHNGSVRCRRGSYARR
mgnify:CR=1 FL=1